MSLFLSANSQLYLSELASDDQHNTRRSECLCLSGTLGPSRLAHRSLTFELGGEQMGCCRASSETNRWLRLLAARRSVSFCSLNCVGLILALRDVRWTDTHAHNDNRIGEYLVKLLPRLGSQKFHRILAVHLIILVGGHQVEHEIEIEIEMGKKP